MTNETGDTVPVKRVPEEKRFTNLDKLFSEEFRRKPSFFVRVPGRVNLIGEHIDYCGYPVLPMALEQDILIATGQTADNTLRIRNVNKKYIDYDYSLNSCKEIEIKADDNGKPYWYNYVLCGIKGAMEYTKNDCTKGLSLYIDGNIPPASGLSSSSALVSAACLSFLYAQSKIISKSDIASLCARSERYIGTEGGGMDQAIAFLGEKYCAQYITWNPLTATAVTLPEESTFVVAHSLAEANKAATNDFNLRVMECRLAAKILASVTGVSTDKADIVTLSEVQNLLGNKLSDMVELVHKYLPQELYTKEEICKILKVDIAYLESVFLTPNTRHISNFKLKQRALHVYEEAMRVENFRHSCMRKYSNGLTNGPNGLENSGASKCTIEILGKLMSKSHESLKELYECSHHNLDQLVNISKEMNIHSRLTGAGWGGCVVALCPKTKVAEYVERLKDFFYEKQHNLDREKADCYVFATTPNYGAIIFANED